MIECRVEREGFVYEGRKRSRDSRLIVSDEIYKIYGPRGTGALAFIAMRPDKASHPGDAVAATKGARALATRKGVDLSKVKATGRTGQVTKEDVYRHVRETRG